MQETSKSAGTIAVKAPASTAHATAAPAAGSGNIAMLVVLYVVAFASAFNENIINVALLEISSAFGVATTTAQWLITGYMILTSIMTASMGFLSQRFSTRKLFAIAATCIVAGGVVCMVAPSFWVLLPARIIQSVGSGIFFPLMMNAVLALAPREKVGFYLSIGGACITLGPAFGPVISGLVDTFFGWRSIFVFPVVTIVVASAVALRTVRNVGETRDVQLDVPSVILMAVGLVLFVYGMGLVMSAPVTALVLVVAAVVVLAVFTRRELSLDQPLLDLRPMGSLDFWPSCILVVVAMMTTFSMSVLLPLFYEGSAGMNALMAGLLILPAIFVNAITSIAGGRIMDGAGEWPLLPAGFALVVVGQVLVSLVSGSLSVVGVVLCSVIVYAGVGLVLSPSQTAGLKTLPGKDQGTGTALLNSFQMVAASFGPSLFIGLLTAGAEGAAASGADAALAQATGFSQAVAVAAGIAVAGLAVSVWYARRAARRAA
jgi:DHA2 family lincomycin resistance protein-like MFS transporter